MLDAVEKFYLRAMGNAMRACNDALSLAIYNELQDYRANFKVVAA